MRALIVAALGAVLAWMGPAAAQSYRAIVAAADGFNGTALVARGRRVEMVEGVGLADSERGVAMTPATRFETGSVSKWIAAIVVLKLVDQKKLDLDKPIARYLPDYRADTGARLTLRLLLSHSSGLPNDIVKARRSDPSIALTEREQMDAVRRYASGDLAFAPGTAWDYSHSNWLVVKAVVERVSGVPYARLVDRLLVRPLGLRDSGIYHGDSAQVPKMAAGYARLSPAPERKPVPIPDFMAMAGGYYSSAPDMLKLMEAVLGGRYLSAASRKALLTVAMPEQHYALGGRVRIEQIGGKLRAAVWNDGSNGGFRMVARRVLADGHSVVLFTNASYDPEKLGALASKLLDASYAAPAAKRSSPTN